MQNNGRRGRSRTYKLRGQIPAGMPILLLVHKKTTEVVLKALVLIEGLEPPLRILHPSSAVELYQHFLVLIRGIEPLSSHITSRVNYQI